MRHKAGIRLQPGSGPNDAECQAVELPDGQITTAACSSKYAVATIHWSEPPRRVLVVAKPSFDVRENLVSALTYLVTTKRLEVYVQKKVACQVNVRGLRAWEDAEEEIEEEIDFVVCLGGDGTLLYISSMFNSAVPPVISFNLGSLGFLTPFKFCEFEEAIDRVMRGGFSVTMRSRLRGRVFKRNNSEPIAEHRVVNDVVIDRGPAPYLSDLECYIQGKMITRVQADGVILASSTGSTAYSLSAGGSMMHPSVHGMIFTPICPHSLSFRPVVLPDTAVVCLKVADGARSSAWVAFDGRDRVELQMGDYVEVSADRFPLPSINRTNDGTISEWFSSLASILNWNLREKQKALL